jgi:SAM-dependent methyltransferase
MTWDPVWEKIFKERDRWGKYPPLELVRFIAGNYYAIPDRRSVRILEIGCGPGGGPAWYIAREGFSFFGIDASATALEKARQRFRAENLCGEFQLGLLDRLPYRDGYFDCVVDVAALQCNSEADTRDILRDVLRVLQPGGRHFSFTSQAGTWGDETGIKLDSTTYQDVQTGPFAHMGVIRFATRQSLEMLYRDFSCLQLEYTVRTLQGGTREIRDWVVTCQKS